MNEDTTSNSIPDNKRPGGWTPITNTRELIERIDQDPWLEAEIKKDPRIVAAVFHPPLETDVWIYRIVVIALGSAVLASIGGAIFLVAKGASEVPFQSLRSRLLVYRSCCWS